MKYFRFYKNEIFSGTGKNLFTSTEIFSGTGEMQKWSCPVPEAPFIYLLWCASSACRVSSEHLNYAKHSMVRAVY